MITGAGAAKKKIPLWQVYEWVVSRVIYDWVMGHVVYDWAMSHVMIEWVMSNHIWSIGQVWQNVSVVRVWMSHESWMSHDSYEWVMSHVIYDWVKSHVINEWVMSNNTFDRLGRCGRISRHVSSLATGKFFSKVYALLNLPYKSHMQLTFENFSSCNSVRAPH